MERVVDLATKEIFNGIQYTMEKIYDDFGCGNYWLNRNYNIFGETGVDLDDNHQVERRYVILKLEQYDDDDNLTTTELDCEESKNMTLESVREAVNKLLNNNKIKIGDINAGKYNIITLCGSTKFKEKYLEVQKRLTLEGNIVISVGLFGHSGDYEALSDDTKKMLDDMHKQKIDMADEIFVINVGGYIGESTRDEIIYAKSKGKKIRYLEKIS